MKISRELAIELGQEAVAITRCGSYQAPSGKRVEIADWIRASREGTEAYPPDRDLPDVSAGQYVTVITVENDATLDAALRLSDQGHKTVVLNFASATHPGGGFLNGARAQEEYLARSSALYECLAPQPMYDWHARHYDPLYSDYALYSPQVPVFRGRGGQLLEAPHCVGVITCAAVNANRLPPERHFEIEPAMRSRIERVLAIGHLHQHDAIVLGAWGCGAFGNDGYLIARLFAEALQGRFQGAYRRVTFAVTDWSEERRFIGPFAERFVVTNG